MSDIVERLRDMFVRFGGESNDDAATRRVKTAKEAADEIELLRAQLAAAVPEGFVLVPRVATEAMCRAIRETFYAAYHKGKHPEEIWTAMVEAAGSKSNE